MEVDGLPFATVAILPKYRLRVFGKRSRRVVLLITAAARAGSYKSVIARDRGIQRD
jgi:hypothetical protein